MNVVQYENLRFTVLSVEDRRIDKVKVEILPVKHAPESKKDED